MPYCCTTDVVYRSLTASDDVKYPEIRKRLLEIMEADQLDRQKVWEPHPGITEAEWMEPDWARAREVLAILAQTKLPSARNIGLDGSRAVWLIAKHNGMYENIAPIVLKKMRYLFYRDKSQVFYQGIPFLVDSLLIQKNNWSKSNKQLFGTQGYFDEDGVQHSYPIANPAKLEERCKRFDISIPGKCKHTKGGIT
jgi:hypothetical protein